MATASRPVLRGVIFDMDGTLTKPNLDFTEMYRRVRAPLNLSYARDPAGQAAQHSCVSTLVSLP